jgi:tetratricopeptide (TPR) repeat protein
MESEEQQKKEETNLNEDILAERIEQYSDLFETKFKRYRNVGIIILTLFCLLGIGVTVYVSKTTVRETLKSEIHKHFDEVFTDDYADGKITSRSDRALSEIIDTAEEKSREIFGRALNFSQWMEFGSRAFHEGKYTYSIVCFEKAIKYVPPDYKGIDGSSISNAYLSLVETCIITSNYDKAEFYLSEYENKYSPSLIAKNNYAVFYFYKIILTTLLKDKTGELDTKLSDLLQKEPIVVWDFNVTQKWMKKKLKPEAFNYVDSILKSIIEKASDESWINYKE